MTPPDICKAICAAFVNRAEAQHTRGIKRDRAALEYICGAAAMYELCGNKDAVQALLFLATMVSVRGYSWVLETATRKQSKSTN